jgi:hypothetical protein
LTNSPWCVKSKKFTLCYSLSLYLKISAKNNNFTFWEVIFWSTPKNKFINLNQISKMKKVIWCKLTYKLFIVLCVFSMACYGCIFMCWLWNIFSIFLYDRQQECILLSNISMVFLKLLRLNSLIRSTVKRNKLRYSRSNCRIDRFNIESIQIAFLESQFVVGLSSSKQFCSPLRSIDIIHING